MEKGICSPLDIKLFIKDEPLTDKKYDDHRERLIACLAVEDQLLDHVIFSNIFRTELGQYAYTANKVGWTPIPSGFKQIFGSFERPVAIDKSAWDWTLPAWCVNAFFELHFERAPDHIRRIVWYRLQEVLGDQCVYRFPDGMRVRQNFQGLMKSGWYMTISMNSTCQVFQHVLACLRSQQPCSKIWAMGDDMLIEKPSDLTSYLDELRQTGCLVKHAKDCMEFAGMAFKAPDQCQPIYGDKHRFRLAYVPEHQRVQVATALSLWYALAPDISPIREFVSDSLFTRRHTILWALGLTKLDFDW